MKNVQLKPPLPAFLQTQPVDLTGLHLVHKIRLDFSSLRNITH